MQHITLTLNQRAVIVRDGKPVRALGPGRYTFWKHYDVQRWETSDATFVAPQAIIAAIPTEWYETVHLAAGQYGIVMRDERPIELLHPGVHRIWKVEANIALRVFAQADPLPELTPELVKSIPAGELLQVTLELNQRAVLLRDGVPERVLAPGHHAFWGKHNKLHQWNLDELVFVGAPDVVALFPPAWFTTVALGPMERAIVRRDDKPVKFLRPGVHRVWLLDARVTIDHYGPRRAHRPSSPTSCAS